MDNSQQGYLSKPDPPGQPLQIKPADLILVRGTDWMGKVIEEVTDSVYSHLAGLVKPNELIEAQGFRETGYQGLDFYQGQADVFTCDELTDDQRAQIVAYVMKEVGTGYGYKLIGWELGHYILHLDLPFLEDGRNDCSTLWANAYRSVGVDPYPSIQYPVPGDTPKSTVFRLSGSF